MICLTAKLLFVGNHIITFGGAKFITLNSLLKSLRRIPYWMGSTVTIDNGFVYLIDDEDVSVHDINSSYCWFKAKTMKYRVIPD